MVKGCFTCKYANTIQSAAESSPVDCSKLKKQIKERFECGDWKNRIRRCIEKDQEEQRSKLSDKKEGNMTAREKVLLYLKDADGVCTVRYTAFKLQLSESSVRKAAESLVADGLVRRSKMWVDRDWQYRRAGYITVYRYVG